MALVKSGFSGGGFFRPKEYLQAKALLVEPISSAKRVNKYGAEQDHTTCDITVFTTEEQLTGKAAPEVLTGVTIGGGVLATDMAGRIGTACIIKLAEAENKKGSVPLVVARDVDLAVGEAVEVYYNNREEARAAATPDFLK